MCFHFSNYSISFQARAQWTTGNGAESHGEIGIRFLGGRCEVTSILNRQISYQQRVTVISMEIEGPKLRRMQQQISHQTGRWFKDNSPEITLGWSSLWILLCVQRTQDQGSFPTCFTFLGELLPGALAHLWPHSFLQGPNQEIFILWVSYLQNFTLQFCNCEQSWITV